MAEKTTRKMCSIDRKVVIVLPDGTCDTIGEALHGVRKGWTLRLEGVRYVVTDVERSIEQRTPAHEGGRRAWVQVDVYLQIANED